MLAIILAALLAAPPQSTLPPRPKAAACKCGDACPCMTAAPPASAAEPASVIESGGKRYTLRVDGSHWPDGQGPAVVARQTVRASAIDSPGTPVGNSSEAPNSSSGCRIVNGVMVCPTRR